MQSLAKTTPELVGGSADLDPSTFTWLKGQGDFENPALPDGRRAGTSGGRVGIRGAERPLRRARARHGLRGQRHGASRWLHPLRLDVSDLLGLHAPGGSPLGPGAARLGLGLHARLGCARRGRADAPGRRALHGAEGDSRVAVHTTGRCQRDGLRMAGRDREPSSADGDGAHETERSHARPGSIRARGRASSRRVRVEPERRQAGRSAAGQQARRCSTSSRPRGSWRERASRRAWCRCPAGSSSRSNPRNTASPCCRDRSCAGCRSSPGSRSAGKSGWAIAVDRSESTTSAHRHPVRTS